MRWIALVLGTLSLLSPAYGQESAEERARQHFIDAQTAFNEGRLADARESLVASLDLARRPATALNLARVEERRGALVAAKRLLREILDGEYGETSARIDRPARELLGEVEQQIARVIVRVDDEDEAIEIELDGAPAGTLEPGGELELELDIVEHFVVGRSPDGRRASRRLRPHAGERLEVTLRLPARAEPEPEPEPGEPGDPSAGPWVLIGGGAAAVIAGAVVLGLVQSDINAIESAERGEVWSDYEDRHESTVLRSAIGFAMVGVGVALTLTGVIWRVTEDVDVQQAGLGASVRARF